MGLRELTDVAPEAPTEWPEFMMSPLFRVREVGKKGFWNVVNGLTDTDLGAKINREWRERVIKVKERYQVTLATSK